jgi:endonuclease-3
MRRTLSDTHEPKGRKVSRERKLPFDIEEAISRVREAVKPFPKAALFELAAEGHTSVFEVLIACIISIRTRDETTLPVARKLFAQARTPAQVVELTEKQIDRLIGACTFHEAKAKTIRDIARKTVEEHGGALPWSPSNFAHDVLMSFHGVGPKCANLTLGIACGLPLIGVDIHVHRVTNRWGYVRTTTPEKTMAALREKLPQSYWIEINALLVPFGKHVCTGVRPKCSTCPLVEMCRQVGVVSPR